MSSTPSPSAPNPSPSRTTQSAASRPRDLECASHLSVWPSSTRRYNQCVEPLQHFGRTLLLLGAVLIAVGALLYFGGKLPFRLGRLPGDIVHRGQHTTFYFPIVTCLVLSVALSLLFWLCSHWRR